MMDEGGVEPSGPTMATVGKQGQVCFDVRVGYHGVLGSWDPVTGSLA